MSKGRDLSEVIKELQRQSDAKADYIAPARGMRMQEEGNTFEINHLKSKEQLSFDSSTVLHRQIGQALSIPANYYDLMKEKKPELLSRNINAWFADLRGSFMIRSFQYPDLSKYGLSNAVTSTSHDIADYDRATELEGIGWKVATMESGLWEQVNGNSYMI